MSFHCMLCGGAHNTPAACLTPRLDNCCLGLDPAECASVPLDHCPRANERPEAPKPSDPRMTPRDVDAVVEATRRAKLME